MKKLLSLLLAAVLALGLSVSALAWEDTDPPQWQQWGYDSLEEYLADCGETEEEYYEEIAFFVRQEKEELGLTFDINVMLDGRAMGFDVFEPEIVNGRVMIPVDALQLLAGGFFDYDSAAGTLTVEKDGKTLTFTVGGDRLSITEDGAVNEIALDAAPYVKEGGSVYTPLRAAAEALGYDVFWSDTYRTAVLIDKEAAVAEFNKNFTVLNAVLAMGSDLDRTQTYKGDSKLDVKVTLFDSLDGDKTYSGSVSAAVVQNGTAAQGTVRYDVGDLLGLIAALSGEPDEADAEELDALAAALDDGIEMIIDLDGGKLYFRGSLFALGYGADIDLDGDAWLSMDFGALGMEDFSALTELAQKTYTIGDLVYLLAGYEAPEPVYLVESLAEAESELAFLGDSHFTKRGGVWHYEETLPDLDGEGSGSVRMDVTVKDGVATGVKASLSYDIEDSWYAGIDSAARLSCDFDLSPLKASLNGSFHLKNVCLVEFGLTAESKAAPGTEVPSAPPAGAEVIDLFASLLGSSVGIIGGADGPAAIWVA